jgi:hypothetical protein
MTAQTRIKAPGKKWGSQTTDLRHTPALISHRSTLGRRRSSPHTNHVFIGQREIETFLARTAQPRHNSRARLKLPPRLGTNVSMVSASTSSASRNCAQC